MSAILDDLKMLADHCDQENGDEPCDLEILLIRAIAEIRNLRQQPVSTTEVPMPDVHDYGYRDSDIGWVETLACDESDVLAYGDARESAGYARGLADRFDLAHELEGIQADVDRRHNFDATCRNTLARVIAALRGEVK